ncbi:KH domain-containing protein SPIN1 [Acorus calamus]|uniref:Branchpoint-bridging protein n=1 Tax=Acorus calamus TaxID=4465 RepID=A0AAV9CNP9_ACOCL|nr:KH domain-containing protein SPIN1 [Acorus calamus]
MLGPLQLPDIVKNLFNTADLNPETCELNGRLIEINKKLKELDSEGGSPSSPMLYNKLGFRPDSEKASIREKLVQERKEIISKLVQKNPTLKAPSDHKPPKFCKKLYIHIEQYPGYNFVGLIIGPRGNTQKRMEKDTGAQIRLHGKGCMKEVRPGKKHDPYEDDLHVLIEVENQKSLDDAVAMVEKLLVPLDERENKLKQNQLRELAKLSGKLKGTDPRISLSHAVSVGILVISPSLALRCAKPVKEIDYANLYVCYLPQAITEDGLRVLFSPFGKIVELKVVRDKASGLSRGFGFVRFADPAEAADAVSQMNGCNIEGGVLGVRVAGLALGTPMISAGQAHVHERVDRTGLLPVPPSWPCGPGSAAPIENYSPMSWPSLLPQYESPYPAFTLPQINTNVSAQFCE